jgi:tripartite-type tricarboxylate transporter receptor subunit TctC
MMSTQLSKRLGVPVNIVNKPAASGVSGTLDAVTAAPDGYTLLADCPGTSSVAQAWMKNLPYKMEERTFIGLAVVFPSSLVVRANAPYNNLAEMEKYIRTEPANFRWAVVGTTQSDFGLYLLRAALRKKGVDLSKTKSVSFQAGGPALIAVAGGHVDIKCSSQGQAQPYVTAGKVKYIAVLRKERTNVFPGIATTVEQGFPTVLSDFWVGYSAAPGLPAPIVQTWEKLIKEIVEDPAMAAEWEKVGGIPSFLPKEPFRKFVMDETNEVIAVTGQ